MFVILKDSTPLCRKRPLKDKYVAVSIYHLTVAVPNFANFEVPMQHSDLSIDLAEDKRFFYMVQDGTSMTEEEVKSILRTFMPKSISRKMVLKEMIDLVASEVNRNCGRTRSSLATRIGSTFKQYSKEISNLGNELIENIEQAMQKGKDIRKDSAESIKNELTSLSNTSGKLEENMKKLEVLWNEIN